MSKKYRAAGRLADFISSSSPPNHHTETELENATQRQLGELARRVEGLETALNAILLQMGAEQPRQKRERNALQPKPRQLLIQTADDVFDTEEA